MDIFTHTQFNFMAYRRPAVIFSTAIVLLSLLFIGFGSLNFGIDFTGGTIIEVRYREGVELSQVRHALEQGSFHNAIVQHFGSTSDVLIRIPPRGDLSSAALSDQVMALLHQDNATVELRRQEFVGPQVGEELAENGGLALIYAIIGILIYVAIRFEYRFAIGSIIALLHDVTVTVGFFAVTRMEFDLTVLAAILAVIGYSLNDTIVVFDRVRENFLRKQKADKSVESTFNDAINQTLSRTILTSGTTLIVLVALFLFGGELLRGFSTALIVGIGFGTYSSVYVASVAALMLGVSRQDLLPVEKEGKNSIDDLP